MKKELGIMMHQGVLTVLYGDGHKCRCIKNKVYEDPIFLGGGIPPTPTKQEWIKDEIYDYVIDQNDDNTRTNPYSVFINVIDRNNFTKEEFDEYFLSVEEFRNKQISELGI
jgi:hypothetical protein